jgi:hypothetical protein
MTYLLGSKGDFEAGMQSGLRALTIATSLGDLGLEVWTSIGLGRVYFGQANYRAAIERMRWVTGVLKDAPLDERFGRGSIMPSVACRGWLALCLSQECRHPRRGHGLALSDHAPGLCYGDWRRFTRWHDLA